MFERAGDAPLSLVSPLGDGGQDVEDEFAEEGEDLEGRPCPCLALEVAFDLALFLEKGAAALRSVSRVQRFMAILMSVFADRARLEMRLSILL